ncbi:MAG: pyruvate kinase [Clostridiales bacterium]|jgi:pyruvate kinase|nr:pyruvate kinase [Clostridiales bacterium]
MLKTKIICTLGPAVDDKATMRELIQSGLDVARMNFSHGSHQEHLERLKQFRGLCRALNQHIPILLDTKGPEIRLGDFREPVTLTDGQAYTLTTADTVCGNKYAQVSYKDLPADVKPGNHILIDDGLIEMKVVRVAGNEIRCTVINGGEVSSHKSVNVPGVSLRLPALTDQDRDDILFAIENRYDYIAVSFVRKREDITEIIRFLNEHDGGDISLIAKIESREGVDNLNDIIKVSDGIMVARGDLGVEIPMEDLPMMQKDMIRRCYSAGKPVITATQMLDSMIRNPRPTRAEATDVANAILDGTSAIMLSGETASGKYPVDSLKTMCRIAAATESSIDYWRRFTKFEMHDTGSITQAISHATCTTAMDTNAAAIVAVTTSGITAQRISSFRPACPIVAATTNKRVFYRLRLNWGVLPVLADVVNNTDELFDVAIGAAQNAGVAADGDIIVITAGVPVGMSGTTNMLKVQMVGNVLCRGNGLGAGMATGTVCIWDSAHKSAFARGCILVIGEITDETLPMIRQANAVVLSGEDKEGKAATLQKALEIPVLTDADGAMSVLTNGTFVHVDAKSGTVKCVV